MIMTILILVVYKVPIKEAQAQQTFSAQEVLIQNFAYSPATITIDVGETVTWTNLDSAPHTVSADDDSFSSDTLNENDTFSHTFSTAGVFSYFCQFHSFMKAEIVVNEAPTELKMVWLPIVKRTDNAGNASPTPGQGSTTPTATSTRTPVPSATTTPTATALPSPTPTRPAEQIVRWSDPAAWGGSVPTVGQAVTIPAGKFMLLDTNPPALQSLAIDGTLIFDNQDLNLTAGWIIVHGKLEIGTPDHPYTNKAIITLNGPAGQDIMGMGSRVLGVMGNGEIQMVGETRTSWTHLNATANKGEAALTLASTPNWRVGDRIVVASTDFDFRQSEDFIITTIQGAQVQLDAPLAYTHWGETTTANGQTIEQRAEVGLLSRNIVIQGDASSETDGLGGHMMVMGKGKLALDGVELFRMGRRGELARYPIHFHLMGDAARGSSVQNTSIHRSFNRCITIHGSNGVLLKSNVAYDAPGHCYFLEDGAEFDNVLADNLGLKIYRPAEEDALLASDTVYLGPAVFWITNPANHFHGNVAAGSEGTGYWVALPEHPTGPSANATIWNRRMTLAEFDNNLAHSNGVDGLHVDNGPSGDQNGDIETTYYAAHADPTDAESEIVTVTFSNFTAYKNRNRGVWLRGGSHELVGAHLADNAIGATFASDNTVARNSIFVGETANKGTPEQWEINEGVIGLDGRSLPRSWQVDFPIRGFEFYDGKVGVENSYFAKFEPNSQRQAAALSYLDFTDFPIDPHNYANHLVFDGQTNRVYLATRGAPAEPDQNTEDGYRSAVFYDSDGSITGTPARYVTVDNPFLYTDDCAKREDWNAWICQAEFVSLSIQTDNAELNSVSLARSDGATHTMFGVGQAPSNYFRTMIRPAQEYTISFDDHLPAHFTLVLQDGAGKWLRLKTPYDQFARVYRYGSELAPSSNLSELDAATRSTFYYDGSAQMLYLKVAAAEDYEAIDIEAAGPPAPVTGNGTGLKGAYFSTIDLTGAAQTRIDPTINFRWEEQAPMAGMPADEFSVRWRGQVEATEAGQYTFTTITDDGVRLWICGQQLIDDWTGHGALPNSGSIALTAGQKCDIVMEYFDGSSHASAELWWEYGVYPRHLIPQKQLYPAP
ncbi:MAG: cupredoxin domain-containing protein [Caldilineaceae bacterium]|nr:cupredoxin domain-containing protein [Caldilineaceae bacterium]